MPITNDPIDVSSPRILVAEDNPFLREMIAAQLRAHRYRVVEAASGDHALVSFKLGGIDVLVTDVMMPGELDGWSLAEQARAIDPSVAVVYSSSAPADSARQVGGSLHLRKPYNPDALVEAISRLTSWRHDEGATEA